jgi:histidinol-phosphate aminotransferase
VIELRSYVNDIKPYKPGKPIDEVVRELGITGDVIKLASNENPLGPSPKAVKAIEKNINTINLYPDDNCFYLKKAISAKFHMPSEQIIIGSGSVELIELIFKAYVNPGDEVIMSDPSFIMYRIACQIYGGKRVAIPLHEYHHDIDTIAEAVTEKTKILILDNPINPTGTIIDEGRFRRFVEQIPDHIILVADEAYREYIENAHYPKTLDYLKQKDNIVILYTFSKIYGLAGLRVGYGFASPDIISALMKVRLPFNVNSIAQIGAAAALDDMEFVHRSQKNNETGKEYLYKELTRIGLAFTPTFGNFVLVHFQTEARSIFEKLQARGVITRTVMEYGLPSSIRITIGTPRQNEQLIRCLTEIV